ncbi:MAG: hypothetical protein E7487_03145 [Ruminococcaceae bacterium]|nr:hypothetical protein [Oscillospiraceae bacterium]
MPDIIGTLKERSLHAVLKRYLQPDESKHEVRIGRYVADILDENGITEIQTRQFYKMNNKLAFFLKEYPVTVVYPVARAKWISWMDPETGEVSQKRRSPKTGKRYEVFRELQAIKAFLKEENLTLKIMMVDVEEYRLQDGWGRDGKRGSHRMERIPVALGEEYVISCREDYFHFIPESLPESFTVKDFAGAAGVSPAVAQRGINVLKHMEVIAMTGKKGRAYLYCCTTEKKMEKIEDSAK